MSQPSYKTPQEMAQDYIAEHRVNQMFSSILSALMMHKPKDPVNFIQNTLDEVKLVGVENVDWETFVYDLHPYRDPKRLDLIKDNSIFQQEAKKEEEAQSQATSTAYKPDVFKLTEPRSATSGKGTRLSDDL
ncbi:uncharacterized protein [Watersipora subatra]|uniref:uncharacterized protein n=1 Tax=Watersipora subatra TaxID=2589382 RepID=UPI00355B9DB0